MRIKKVFLGIFLSGIFLSVNAQTETTQEFHENHEEAFTLFFYKNSLRMLNMADNEAFAELIRDIDKMKFVRIEKSASAFTRAQYDELVKKYHSESFDDLMTLRSQGANLNVFIKEKDKVTHGLVVLMEDEQNFSILDIKGAVPLQRIAELVSKIQSADAGDFDWD